MGTKILLPHALVAIPRIPTRSLPHARLGFQPSTLALRPSRLVLHPLTAAGSRRSFVARAEEEPAAGGGEVEEGGGEGEGAVAVLEKGEEEEVTEARKQRVKLGDIMGILNKRAVGAVDEARPIPDIRVGDVLRIKLGVPSRRRKFAFYRGIVISRQNAGIHTTIRVRRIIAGVGVEIVFPLYSPLVQEITVMSHRKVRRARLYYLRDKLPRFSTFKKK